MRFDGTRPIFLQIVDMISEGVISGRYVDRIPSVREIAVELEVNPNTVARSYMYLQDRGIIKMRRGLGYYVAEEGMDLIMKSKREDFLQKELPSLFKAMDLLNISIEDLANQYDNYKKDTNEDQNTFECSVKERNEVI